MELDLGPLVQDWVDGLESGDPPNHGLILRVLTEGRGSERVRFYSREAAVARRPRLEVVYSPPPVPRWEGPGGGEQP